MKLIERYIPSSDKGLYVTHSTKSLVVGFREDDEAYKTMQDFLGTKRLYAQVNPASDVTSDGKYIPNHLILTPFLPGQPRGKWGTLTTGGEGNLMFSADVRKNRDFANVMKFGRVKPVCVEFCRTDHGQPYARILMPYKDASKWSAPREPVQKKGKKADPAQEELPLILTRHETRIPVNQQLPDRDDVTWIHQLKEELNAELLKANGTIQARINDQGLLELGEVTESWVWR